MPPVERDAPVDRPAQLRHQHSASSDHGRALIPMWDSSDPERAPPPLPLNPQSPSVASRQGTSAAIQSAHAAMTERAARESNTALVPSLAKRIGEGSSPTKGPSHRRMQSLQPGTVRELGLMIEGGSSSRSNSPEKRTSTPESRRQDPFVEEEHQRAPVAASGPRPGPSLTPIIRPTARRSHQSILGENTPPQSATMLALRDMATPAPRELPVPPPKDNVSNVSDNAMTNIPSTSQALVRTPQSLDALSGQILSLTSIATSLQKEMSQLSRRSRDNATDLLSLKEATTSRDEDIRKSLRELTSNLSEAKPRGTRDPYGGPLLIEPSRPTQHHGFSSPPMTNKPFGQMQGGKITLPRIPSPNSFAASLDRESMSTPSLYGADPPATIALLEKIAREMGTREGQEMLIGRLGELSERLSGMATAAKVDELRRVVEARQQQQQAHAIIPSGQAKTSSLSNDSAPQEMTLHCEAPTTRRSSAPVVNDDMIRVIKTVKDSVSASGGLTAEVKALVRELRGEVLGMGREIGRRLDEVASASHSRSESATKQEMTKVVEEGLNEMKTHINHLIKEHRRQSASREDRMRVDYGEVYNAVRAALKDAGEGERGTRREDVLDAVREAWENYKPEISVETVGLEREEILATLQEGLAASRLNHEEGVSREEILEAVVQGLQSWSPAKVETPASLSRDEILEAVRECLEEFEFPNPFEGEGVSKEDVLEAVKIGLAHDAEKITRGDVMEAVQEGMHATMTKEDVVEAVQVGLEGLVFPACDAAHGLRREDLVEVLREELGGALVPTSISKEDVLEAVHRGLQGFEFPDQSRGVDKEEIIAAVKAGIRDLELPDYSAASALVPATAGQDKELGQRLQDILDFMRAEFKAVSDEAKQNVAASGRDTEQVLDATKDGFHQLRSDMEVYVDRACGQAGQEGFMLNLVHSLDGFRDDVADLVAKSSDTSREVIREEVESLREAVNSSLVPMPTGGGHKEVLEALQDGLSALKNEINSRPIAGVNEILDALQEGLGDLRVSIGRLVERPTDWSANDEILDALKKGLDGVMRGIDALREDKDKALTTFDASPTDMARHEDIKNLEADMVKREDLQGLAGEMVKQADIRHLESLLTDLREKVDGMEVPTAMANVLASSSSASSSASKDDLALMEETLRSLQEAVASVSDTVAGMAVSVLNVSDSVTNVHEKVSVMATPEARAASDPSTREDVQAIETLLRNTKGRLEDLIDGEQAVRKEHIDFLEALIMETRESLSDLSGHLDTVSKKEDVDCVGSLVTQVVAAFDEMKERHEKTLEDPEKVTKTDIDAVESVVLDVKMLVEQVVKADLAALPSKEDITRIEDMLRDFKTRADEQTEEKTKALEVRQLENVGVTERVDQVKTSLQAFQDVVKEKLDAGAGGVDAIHGLLENLGETIGKTSSMGDDIKDMFLVMKDEFEESKAGVVGAKLDTDEKFQQTTETLLARFDEKIGELVAKHDDFQLVMEDRASKGEERDTEMEAAVVGTRAIADELRVLVDTLGTAVTESMEKMEEASKTVFGRVEEMLEKTDEQHLDGKAEHELTREQVREAIGVVEGLKGEVTEYHPQILESIKDVLVMVGQHFEHSKTATLDMQESLVHKIEEAKPEPLMLRDIPQYDDTSLHEKLDQLAESTKELGTLDLVHKQVVDTASEISAFLAAQTARIEDEHEDCEKTLVETNLSIAAREAEKEALEMAIAQLREENELLRQERADELANLKKARQEELEAHQLQREEESALFRAQHQTELETHKAQREEDLERLRLEREEDRLQREEESARQREDLERLRLEHAEEEARFRASLQEEESRFKTSLAEQEQRSRLSLAEEENRFKANLAAEAERHRVLLEQQEERFTSSRREEEARLKAGLADLRAETEDLHRSKSRLSADLSSLETALRLRREELADMESRAEGLERRILEGVMDHSRVLLMAKNKRETAAKDPMSRKRVVSVQKREMGPVAPPAAAIRTGQKENDKPKTAFNLSMSSTPNRRILSLSQINSNAAGTGMKRCNSVKQAGYRKASWTGAGGKEKGYGDLTPRRAEKENRLDESDEEDSPHQSTPRNMKGMTEWPLPTGDSEMTLAETEMGYRGGRGGYDMDSEGEGEEKEWKSHMAGTETLMEGGEVVVYGR